MVSLFPMKKLILLSIVMLLAFSSILSIKTFAISLPSVEDAASCSAGTDADGDTLTGISDPDCASFLTVVVTPETSESCTTGIDADGDTLVGVADPDCSSFIIPATTSETLTSCTAGTDADGDTLTGLADPDCVTFLVTTSTSTEATSTPVVSTFSGPSFGSGSTIGGGISSGSPISSITSGSVISATSTATTTEPNCADMFKTYMKKGKKNDINEVKKLQKLLNIKTTGFFGDLTEKAVKTFQEKYTDSVLKPWGLTKSTGYFYKTTQRQANLLLCSSANIPMPELK